MTKFIPQHIADPDYEVEVPEVVKQAQDIMKGKKVPESRWNSLISLKGYLYDLMSDAGIDKSDIQSYIDDINYDLKYADIARAFKEFIASDRTMRSKERYLFPIFTEIKGNIEVEHHKKKIKTASEIISKKEKHVLKPEKEIPQLLSADEARAGYVDRILKGENITCELCGEVIRDDQIQGWWLSIYPAHLTCIHVEFNRQAISAGRRIPFPELQS